MNYILLIIAFLLAGLIILPSYLYLSRFKNLGRDRWKEAFGNIIIAFSILTSFQVGILLVALNTPLSLNIMFFGIAIFLAYLVGLLVEHQSNEENEP